MNNVNKILNISNKIINSNDIEYINSLKNKIDRIYEKHLFSLKINDKLEELSHKPFGYIKNIFESISDDLFKTKKGRLLINQYVKTIKENNTLSNLYILHENIMKYPKNNDIKSFINEAISIIGVINKKEYNDGLNKIIDIIKESFNNVKLTNDKYDNIFNDKFNTINESIDYVVTHKKNMKNLTLYESKINNLCDYIISLNKKENITLNNNEITESVVNINKKDLFESYRNDCVNLIDNIKSFSDDNTSIKLTEIKDKLLKKEYNDSNVDNDLLNLIELKNTLKKNNEK